MKSLRLDLVKIIVILNEPYFPICVIRYNIAKRPICRQLSKIYLKIARMIFLRKGEKPTFVKQIPLSCLFNAICCTEQKKRGARSMNDTQTHTRARKMRYSLYTDWGEIRSNELTTSPPTCVRAESNLWRISPVLFSRLSPFSQHYIQRIEDGV